MASFDDFPGDIVFQILSLLPVICLLRCKYVCKDWQSIILDPIFTQAHLTNSRERPSVLAIVESSDNRKYGFCLISHSFRDSVELLVPSSLAARDKWVRQFTSCDGLVCLTNYRAIDIYLWNPLTRQCCKIPTPNIPSVKWAFIGFYFDSISKDYKILRINVLYQFPVRVELYSTNSDTWKEIKVHKLDTILASMISCGPVIKGALYINGTHEIILFQLRNEKFKPVPLPNTKLGEVIKRRSSVFDYEGRVGLILHCHDDESLSLWSLDEDDGSGIGSWTKNLHLDTSFRIEWTTAYLGDGKLVTSEDWKRNILTLYDNKTKEIKRFQHPTWNYAKSPHKYTESLVSVKGFNK